VADKKQGFNPSKQKVNPSGKYNEKKWVKLGKRDLVNIDEVNSTIYNNMDISQIYNGMDEMYQRERKPGSGKNRWGKPPKKTKQE
jgi:hypothetical protein